MMRLNHPPGLAWFAWLRNLPLRVGVLTGMYLSAVMVCAVLVANRAPFLEHFAYFRNVLALGAFAMVALVPIFYFLRHPMQLFISGVTACLLFSLAYSATGVFFNHLFTRLNKTPFHAFMLGAIVYGFIAVVSWVASMVTVLRRQPIAASRRRPY